MNKEVKSYSQMRNEFYEKYRKEILPVVSKFDAERKSKLSKAIVSASILSLLGIAILLGMYLNAKNLSSDSAEGLFKLAMTLFVIAVASWFIIKKDFENKIKSKIMPTVCSCFGDLEWSVGGYSNGDIHVSSGVVPKYTSASYDDIFRGSHKDVAFEIVEADYDVGSGKSRQNVFDGVIVRIEMNKHFSGHTVITPDFFTHSSPVKGLKHTVLEDVGFEKKFDVFTNDEVDARYLITPSFMERLKVMRIAFDASKIKCAFYQRWLIVALSTKKDLFSLCSLVKPMDDAQQYFQMYEEIVSIVKLIDHFKLDQKIGL